ncbi:M56 family metallopeptidase [Telluribacter sp. SYSU D00476]|uniref:M56 family metallopeptidase n=1 Tax=Telluribacter sp. SYSU D00476 TaxID=2811430 RepID=UPI001FF6DD84|nr:M56 family metallopeptidase [Telluribacter sp. SYSU D00476]
MKIHIIDLPLSQKLIQALSWTLLHSLWQGLVLAVLTGLVLLTLRKARPALRYNALATLLVGFMVVSAGTFWLEYRQTSSTIIFHSHQETEVGSTEMVQPAGAGGINWLDAELLLSRLMDFCTRHASLIVALWFLVFLLKSVKAATGLYYIHRLRHHGIHEVPAAWAERVSLLAQKLKINTAINLVESELVTVPQVAGFLRPIILVPAGFLTNLPYQQVEVILLHELAHIRRKDYLVNLFQSLAENIYFFNPAVLWLSYLLREEREHCCDDLAIAVTQNRKGFVEALVQFQEYNLTQSAHALAFAGRRNHLLDRIKRIIYNNNKPLEAMEKVFVTASLLTIAVLSVAFSPTPPAEVPQPEIPKPVVRPVVAPSPALAPSPSPIPAPPPAPAAVPVVVPPAAPDTITPRKTGISTGKVLSTYHMSFNGKRYEIVEQNGKITGLKIDGVVIPEDQIASYSSELAPVMAEVREHQKEAEIHRAQAEVYRREAEVHRKQAEEHRAQADLMRQEAAAMREQAQKHRREAESMQASQAEARRHADEARREAEVHRQQAEVHRREAEEHRKKAEAQRAEYEKLQGEFINDLIQEGVIQSKKDLSYRLNQDELVVNGKKQPEALHQKMRAKYLKELGVEMFYHWQGKSGIMYSK